MYRLALSNKQAIGSKDFLSSWLIWPPSSGKIPPRFLAGKTNRKLSVKSYKFLHKTDNNSFVDHSFEWESYHLHRAFRSMLSPSTVLKNK
jgi:hypothetical protein